MEIIQNFIPDTAKCNSGLLFDNPPSCITIHWIGPYPGQSPEDVRAWWINSGGEASAHFIIKNNKCVQCWPLNRIAYHAGCHEGNYTSIGIEVCPCNVEGEFSDKSIRTLKALIDKLDPDKKMPIVRHYDWTGKKCPQYYVDLDKWKKLIALLGR